MTLSSARKTIAAATMAAGLIVSGANLALAQTNAPNPTYPNQYSDTNRYNRTTEYRGGGFDWGWLGLLGLFGLLGRRRVTTHETGGSFTRRETFEPRPTR